MSESVTYMLKFFGMFFVILLIIFILAVITPKLASKVDKIISKVIKQKPERVDDDIYKVRSIYDVPKDNSEETNKNNEENGELKNGK